ncbi:MAG: transcriptional repressor [Chloroherpetonaceae bacterium]|nr:transcriptional repressor [Chloroherpetonaceae bacterium]
MTPSIKSAQRKYYDLLKNNDFKVTMARLKMLEVIDKLHIPLTAAEIHEKLKNLEPPVKADLATVYRSLNQFADTGILSRVELGDSSTRFEYPQSHHHHIICVDCGKISNIHLCNLDLLVKEISSITGFTDINHEVIFKGKCGCKGTASRSTSPSNFHRH